MNNFFEKSDISRSEAENIVSDTLSKCDDGELYLENTKSETILFCLLYTSPSPRDRYISRMPSSA